MNLAISGSTRPLGLMGDPVKHSLSPRMHNASFAANNLDFVYVAMNVSPDGLPAAVRGAVAMGFRGFNLTMPHKEDVIAHLDRIDAAAEVSGAVNTVVIESDGTLLGYNTDGYGMMEACREAGTSIEGSRVALVGAGGAAAAIALALCEEHAGELLVFNRNTGRAAGLLERLRESGIETNIESHPIGELDSYLPETDIIVNATSLGMRDGDALPFDVSSLPEGATVCDAVYRPGAVTRLVEVARERGLRAVAGERMLLYQGVAAQRLWIGEEPDVAAMDAALSSG